MGALTALNIHNSLTNMSGWTHSAAGRVDFRNSAFGRTGCKAQWQAPAAAEDARNLGYPIWVYLETYFLLFFEVCQSTNLFGQQALKKSPQTSEEEGEEVEEPPEDEPSLDDQLATAKEDLMLGHHQTRLNNEQIPDRERFGTLDG